MEICTSRQKSCCLSRTDGFEIRYGKFDDWTGNTPSNVVPAIINAGASYRFHNWHRPGEVDASLSPLGRGIYAGTTLTVTLPYTTVGLSVVVDAPVRGLVTRQGLGSMRVAFRVRNLTNARYPEFANPVMRTRYMPVRLECSSWHWLCMFSRHRYAIRDENREALRVKPELDLQRGRGQVK